MDATIWTVIAAGLISWGCFAMWKKGVSRFWRVLVEANERHGTRFGTSPDDMATVVGGNLYQGEALSCTNARHIAQIDAIRRIKSGLVMQPRSTSDKKTC